MQIIPLFPTPVGKFKLERPFTENELSYIKGLEKILNLFNARSVKSYIFQAEELKDLHDFCLKSVMSFVKEVHAPDENFGMRITQSWSNYALENQRHHPHEHPNSFISGVLYVSANANKDKIFFNKSGYDQIFVKPNAFNQFNSKSWWVPVETGELVLFPSHLNHRVEQVVGEERISIAFNTFPTTTLGSELELTELKL